MTDALAQRLALSLPSPLQLLTHPVFERTGLEVYIKRDDLIHPRLSGNKWRKLKYNLYEMQRQGQHRLLTFGGAYSNHLYATAHAVSTLGLEGIALIRGERVQPLNTTLSFLEEAGMKMIFVSRSDYRRRRDADFLAALRQMYGPFYHIPEGGTNALALPGVEEVIFELQKQMPAMPDYIALACGTGGTLSGIISGLQKTANTQTKVIGFSALKGNFLRSEVKKLLSAHLPKGKPLPEWEIQNDYHFGGFARSKPELLNFITAFRQITGIPIEHVYTGKMFYGLVAMAQSGCFPRGSRMVVIHTGGLRA